jgi:hypothetical protein
VAITSLVISPLGRPSSMLVGAQRLFDAIWVVFPDGDDSCVAGNRDALNGRQQAGEHFKAGKDIVTGQCTQIGGVIWIGYNFADWYFHLGHSALIASWRESAAPISQLGHTY